MKKFFAFFFLLPILTFAQYKINYQFSLEFDGSSVTTANGTIQEGQKFTLNAGSFTGQNANVVSTISPLDGMSFELDENSLSENIELMDIKFKNFNINGLGYNELAGNQLFLYFEVAILGENSGLHNVDSNYYLNDGKYATIKIPLTNEFYYYLNQIGLDFTQGLMLAYYRFSQFTDSEITTEIVPGNPDTLVARFRHFSKFGGGKRTLTSVENEKSIAVKSFNLEHNYPNPFNPSTKINFTIPENGFVTLKVYNTIGSEVKTLINGNMNSGAHQITFDASNLPSGVYFYTLTFNNSIQTKRMLLLK